MATRSPKHPARHPQGPALHALPDAGSDGAPATPAAARPRVVQFEFTAKSLFGAMGLIAAVWLLLHALPALLVLVTALMLVGALNPVVLGLEARRMSRTFAICLAFGVGLALTIAVLTLTLPKLAAQVKTLVENEPQAREMVAGYLERSPATATLAADVRSVRYSDLIRSSQSTLLAMTTRTGVIVAYGIASIFLAFYMMIDRDRLRGALFALVPRSHHIRLSRILLNLGMIVGGYIRGQVLTCVMMGGFIFVVLLVCRVPNALALAVFGGVMDLLPYIGIFLTMAPAVIAAAGQGPTVAAVVFALMLLYEELESRVIVPLVYGRALRLPSSVVLFSLIVGTVLGGIAGALLALPLAAAILMLVEELRVELPGQTDQLADRMQRQEDTKIEREYERRAEGLPADEAAAVAVEISGHRKDEEAEAVVEKNSAEKHARKKIALAGK
ncbi:MAG: hypothetical protein JWQ62_3143 [Lacunisphaera sp.]|nr:hypothetical protein [Lacunisphaera sp.]